MTAAATAEPTERPCARARIRHQEAESIGLSESHIFIYDEDETEDSPGLGLVSDGLDGGLFTVFMAKHYETVRGGAGNPPEDNAYGKRSFAYELFGQVGTGVLTNNELYAILLVADDGVRDAMLRIVLAHAEMR